jgi:glycosyltransferase involved in cell wall biosynthesis
MLRVLVFVNWTIHKVRAFDVNIRNPDQIVPGERYWFFKYWPKNVSVDVVGIKKNFFLYPLENLSRIYVQHAIAFNQIKDCDLLLTFDSQSAFLFALLKSKLGIFKSIPHVMIDVGLPNAAETLKTIPSSLIYRLLNQSFNVKSVSHIIFHSACQRAFYRGALGFSNSSLSYIPFGVETDYFKPEPVENEGYIFSAGEYRDFTTLLSVYERWYQKLPELRIRSELPKPTHLPPNVKWLPRAPISTFKAEALKARFVVVPLPCSLRSTGLMTCLQSMALGKAVLTSKVPAIDGYILDGETGVYYNPYDSEDLFHKLSLLSKENNLVERIGKDARKAVEDNFSVLKMGEQLWSCVFKVLKSS